MCLEFCLFVCYCAGFIFINCYVLRVPHMCFIFINSYTFKVLLVCSVVVRVLSSSIVCFVVVMVLSSSIHMGLRFCLCVLLLLGMNDTSCPISTCGVHILIKNAQPRSGFLVKFLYFFRWMPFLLGTTLYLLYRLLATNDKDYK
ncbi:hypothetical protein HanHA300_Chr05g0194491 [Helianthus annuus]|nr:hypothetical protein HanHA300_Chr05g0194491 [Helianthus annuus]KAJ0579070.1 hypothetical protein HanIR_Chr05g0254881 [Helianthus annuus]KAJ0748689.1 hypothetical protein HanOQP8_Chr05g0203841 [Helianthus annuus]